MAIEIDRAMFRRILERVVGSRLPYAREAVAIARIVQLAAGVDLDEDPGEQRTARTIISELLEIAGVRCYPPLPRLPLDDEERRALCTVIGLDITSDSSRELAYALAYLTIAADLRLESVESQLLEDLRRALAIDLVRAGELAELAAEVVTPGIEELKDTR